MSETDLPLVVQPKTFRNHPITFCCFTAALILILITPLWTWLAVIPIAALALWWAYCATTRLTIAPEGVKVERALLPDGTKAVAYSEIEETGVRQGPLNIKFHVGTIWVRARGGLGHGIRISGIPDPHRLVSLIEQRRSESSQVQG